MALIIKTDVDKVNEKLVFFLDGELDLSSAHIFRESIEEEYRKNPGNIELNFERIDFIDSTGLGTLVSLSKLLDEKHRISVLNTKDHVNRVFTITGLDKLFIRKGDYRHE